MSRSSYGIIVMAVITAFVHLVSFLSGAANNLSVGLDISFAESLSEPKTACSASSRSFARLFVLSVALPGSNSGSTPVELLLLMEESDSVELKSSSIVEFNNGLLVVDDGGIEAKVGSGILKSSKRL